MNLPESLRKEIEALRRSKLPTINTDDIERLVEKAYREGIKWERKECAKACEEAGPPSVKRHEGTELETNAKVFAWYGLQFAVLILSRKLP